MADGFRIAEAFVDVHLKDGTKVDEEKIKARLAKSGPAQIKARVDIGDAEKDLNKLSVTGGRVFSPLVAAGIAAGTVLGGPLALGAVPIIFAGVATAILTQNDRVRRSFTDLGHDIVGDLRGDTEVLVPYFEGIAGDIGGTFQQLRPQLRGVFSDLGPEITTLTHGVLDFTRNAMPGFVTAIHSGEPVVQGLADLLAKTGTGLSGFFTELSSGSSEAGQVLSMLGDGIEHLLPFLGETFDFLTRLSTGALPVFGHSIGAVLDVVSGLLGVLDPIAPVLGEITGSVLTTYAAFRLFGSVGSTLTGLAPRLAETALNAGVMTERLTGSAVAGERVAVAGDRVSGALGKIGNALPVVGAAVIAAGLAYDALTISAEDGAAAMEKGGVAADEARRQLEGQTEAFTHGLTYIPVFGDSLAALVDKYQFLVPTVADANAALEKQRSTMTSVQLAQSLLTTAQGDYEAKLAAFGPNAAATIAAQDQLSAASHRVEQAQHDAASATQDHTDRIIAQTNIIAGIINADIGYQQSLLAVKDAQKQADDSVRQYGAGSDQAKEAVLRLEQQVSSAAEAAKRKAEADNASLGPQAQAKAGSDAYANTLATLAAQANGPARSALLGYVARLDDSQRAAISSAAATSGFATEVVRLPNGKTVTIIANTGQALSAIGGVQGALNGLRDRYVNVVVHTVQDIAAGIPHAEGGVFRPMATGGLLKATGYAGGGMRPMSGARAALVPSGDLRIIGDNQRYTELFAPLDGSKRSLSYISYGAAQFGFGLVPAARSVLPGAAQAPSPGTGMAGDRAQEKTNRSRIGDVVVNVTQVGGSPAETGRFVALALRTVG